MRKYASGIINSLSHMVFPMILYFIIVWVDQRIHGTSMRDAMAHAGIIFALLAYSKGRELQERIEDLEAKNAGGPG